jgi:iron complex outermembrane receptor protein
MKKIIITLLLGFFSPTTQNTISEQWPIVLIIYNRVSIYVPELHKGTATDLEGRYSLTNFLWGIWSCYLNMGYSNQVKTIKIKPNQNDLNVTLEPTVFLKWMQSFYCFQ